MPAGPVSSAERQRDAVTTDPRGDQAAVRLRDLERLVELTVPCLPYPEAPIPQAFPRMTPADRAEAEALLERLGDLTEDPGTTSARQRELRNLADVEIALVDIADRGQPLITGDGEIIRDPQTGKPVRDPAVDREARELLARLERHRSRLAGLPPSVDGNSGASTAP